MSLTSYFRSHPRALRILSSFCGILFLSQVLYPTAAWALTSGPAQPEFTSFEPVVTTNMVNDFSGDFTYNLPLLQIPGPNGGGYPISLSYHSGASPEEEASWVGYGWTLNPGAINRQLRGYPDDWNGETVTAHNKSIPNKTVSVNGYTQVEATSYDIPLNLGGTIRYNNYTGFGYGIDAGVSFCEGVVSLGFHVNDGETSFSLTVNPAGLYNDKIHDLKKDIGNTNEQLKNKNLNPTDKAVLESHLADSKAKLAKTSSAKERMSKVSQMASAYGMRAICAQTFPLEANEMSSTSKSLSLGLNVSAPLLEIGPNVNLTGKLVAQTNVPTITRQAFGYLHTSDQSVNGNSALDYHCENPTTYNKRDKFMPPSFADADLFAATGEGIAGAMRFYKDSPQVYHPSACHSSTNILQIGAEVNVGGDYGGSVDVGVGQQTLDLRGYSSGFTPPLPGDEENILRLTNDKGGECSYATSDAPVNAHVSTSGVPGYKSGSFTVPSVFQAVGAGQRSGRSSYVGYILNSDLLNADKKHWRYEGRSLGSITNNGKSRSDIPGDRIGELSVLNDKGQRYNYALPVMAKEDRNLSYGGIFVNPVNNRWASTSANVNEADFINGTESSAQYATAYLLTSICDPDYLDRTGNGPSPDDVGGYTAFTYDRSNNGGSDPYFYNWRMPYKGYTYQDPQLSECYDNRLSFSSGKKEIYYLKEIRTKTHRAVFNTTNRHDGLGAPSDASAGDQNTAPNIAQKQRSLQSIQLFKIVDQNDPGQDILIKEVHFAYESVASKQAWHGIPNTDENNGGKLTLKKVWTEYYGVVPARISPYVFDYVYPTVNYPVTLSNQMDWHDLVEEPAYDNTGTDPWGNYRDDAASTYGHLHPWLDQSKHLQANNNTFDPAAWQLKSITLPSGGQIHVYYEQDDYAYVQNEKAEIMVPLTDESSPGSNTFVIDPNPVLPGGATPEAINSITQQIKNTYVGKPRKMYFRTLMRFDGEGSYDQDQNKKHWEYISGYANVLDAVSLPSGPNPTKIGITLGGGNYSGPQAVCMKLFNAEKRGKNLDGSCTGAFSDDVVSGGGDAQSVIENFASFAGSFLSCNCGTMDAAHSYFRLPVYKRKLGGGIRVARLLMYDPQGDAEGYPAVYGSDYHYLTTGDDGNVISSGVATFEPGSMRDENVLVRPLDAYHQTWADKVISGRDIRQSEGPIGESIYPSPSVGYSKVIITPIREDDDNADKTKPDFTVKDFYTARDPGLNLRLEATSKDEQTDPLTIITGIMNITRDAVWVSQGYSMITNEMHGQAKREATYNGDWHALLEPGGSTYATLTSSTEYDYFMPGESLPVMEDAHGLVTGQRPLGKEMDVAIETRSVVDEMFDGSLECDIGIALNPIGIPLPFIPSFSCMPGTNNVRSECTAHTITKVVSYPAVLKRTKVFKDGIYHVSQNIAFDPNTGEPLITRTHDGFYTGNISTDADLAQDAQGTYTTVNIPACFEYPGMGQVAKGEHKRITSVCNGTTPGICLRCTQSSETDATIHFVANDPTQSSSIICDALNAMCPGDLFELQVQGARYLCNMASIQGSNVHVVPAANLAGSSNLTAFPIPNSDLDYLAIVRSGCNNKLHDMAGSYTYYGHSTGVQTNDWQHRWDLVTALNGYVDGLGQNGVVQPDLSPFDGSVQFQVAGAGPFDPSDLHIRLSTAGGNLTIYTQGPGGNICSPVVLGRAGHFELDPYTGQLAFYEQGNECFGEILDCTQFFAPSYPTETLDHVVHSEATEYAQAWPTLANTYTEWSGVYSEYQKGVLGKWRPLAHFGYLSPLDPGSSNRDEGMYALTQFNWHDPVANTSKWVMNDSVIWCSPDGNVLEEIDALRTPSCAKYGYSHMLPYLIGKNTVEAFAHFESFENQYPGSLLEDNTPLLASMLDHTVAHSGRTSFKMTVPQGFLFRSRPILSPEPPSTAHPHIVTTDNDLDVKAWLRCVDSQGQHTEPLALAVTLTINGTPQPPVPMTRVARTGEWELYDAKLILADNMAANTGLKVEISAMNANTTTWIDDVRIQPASAQLTCYVYDVNTLQLLTTFDDQHFGMYYQYNDEGKLVRKQVETEHGRKTVQETQYNTPKAEAHP